MSKGVWPEDERDTEYFIPEKSEKNKMKQEVKTEKNQRISMCAWYVHVFSARVEGVHTRISKLKPDLQARLRVYLSLFPILSSSSHL